MEIRVDYKSGATRIIDTNTFTNKNPNFIRSKDQKVLQEQCEILLSEIRLRWDLLEDYGLLAEIYYWDNNILDSQNDNLEPVDYDPEHLIKAKHRPAKVLVIISPSDLVNVVRISEDDNVRYWRDLNGKLMNTDGVRRIELNKDEFSAIAATYKWMSEKYQDEQGKRTKELAEIENLFGITHEELAEIVEDEIRLNENQEKSALERAIGKTIDKFSQEKNEMIERDTIEKIVENKKVKYKDSDR